MPSVAPADDATLIDDFRLFLTSGLFIPLKQNLKTLFLGQGTHAKTSAASDSLLDNIGF
jgi:hypothetical protein